MIGGVRKSDAFTETREPLDAAPSGMLLVTPAFGHVQANIEQVTTARLNGLYNTFNMPVVYMSAAEARVAQLVSSRGQNNHLAIVRHPKRMPYKI